MRVEKHKEMQEGSAEKVSCRVRLFFRGLASLYGDITVDVPIPRSIIRDKDALSDYLLDFVAVTDIAFDCEPQIFDILEWDLDDFEVVEVGGEETPKNDG